MKRTMLLGAVVVFLLGVIVGDSVSAARAQEEIQAEQGWEIYHGTTAGTRGGYYVIKHNRFTGKTLVLRSGKWLLYPEEEASTEK